MNLIYFCLLLQVYFYVSNLNVSQKWRLLKELVLAKIWYRLALEMAFSTSHTKYTHRFKNIQNNTFFAFIFILYNKKHNRAI